MPPYNRYRGERVAYSQRQTALYKSQRIRWIKGLTYRPDDVIYEEDGVRLFRYRSYRATDGFWETRFDPAGFLPGESGNPGGLPVCGLVPSADCLSDRLAYVRSQTFFTQTVECVDSNGGENIISQNTISTDNYVVVPGGTPPPNDGLPIAVISLEGDFTGAYPVGCINGVITPYTATEPGGRVVVGWYFTRYDESADKVYRYTIDNHTVALSDTDFIPDPATGQSCKFTGYSGSINLQFFFVNDPPINDHSYCFPGNPGTPPIPPVDTPLRYECNCPDFTKNVEALPWSRYTSELSDRLIVGNTHSGDMGPCKHVYSAAVATGERFRDPATVRDPWTLQDYPLRTVVFDWLDPIPPTLNGDNNIEQLRQWREDRRVRRRDAYRASSATYQQRQAEARKKREQFFQSIIGNQQRIDNLSDADYNEFVQFRDRQNSARQQWTQRRRNTYGYDDDGSSMNP